MNADEFARPPAYSELSRVWRTCVGLAWDAFRHGSLPIGAVVTDGQDRILATGRNRLAEFHEASPHVPGTPYLAGSRLAHAEVNALLDLGYPDAAELYLYTTTEPCPLCMGAARMSSIDHVTYASRDPWAGCAIMATSVPYLVRRGPSVGGPMTGMEHALIAWQTSVHVTSDGHEPHFMASWRDVLPEACDAGVRLSRSGELRALANAGAPAEEGWELLLGTLV